MDITKFVLFFHYGQNHSSPLRDTGMSLAPGAVGRAIRCKGTEAAPWREHRRERPPPATNPNSNPKDNKPSSDPPRN